MPASHVYVRHLADPSGPDGVRRLPDPIPADRRKVPGGWWPPVALDAGWIEAHVGRFDVFHVHFGFDALSPDELDAAGVALRQAGVPLVFTVHDLRNPHHADTALHDAQLDVLLGHAAEVITLTDGAAAAIAERWGRAATVLPHPHVVDRATLARRRPEHQGFVIGVHAKSLRANMDVTRVAEVIARTVAELPGARLRLDVHDEIFEPGYYHAPRTGAELRRLGGRPGVELREHPFFADGELWDYLAGLDVSVLPYTFGTHSGWLEACYDLGTTVLAPTCGFYAEQAPCLSYAHDIGGLDEDSLADAVRIAYRERPAWRADPEERVRQRRRLARSHRRVYERVLR